MEMKKSLEDDNIIPVHTSSTSLQADFINNNELWKRKQGKLKNNL